MSDSNNDEVERVILMPVDRSEHTERAIDWYVENLMKPNDLVQMIHIVEPMYTSTAVGIGMEVAFLPVEDLESKIKKQLDKGKSLVKKFTHELQEKGGRAKGYVIVDSKVGEAIIKVCHTHKVDLIIVANRGEGLIRRTFLGSVSDYVLHHADRPVVIIPPKH